MPQSTNNWNHIIKSGSDVVSGISAETSFILTAYKDYNIDANTGANTYSAPAEALKFEYINRATSNENGEILIDFNKIILDKRFYYLTTYFINNIVVLSATTTIQPSVTTFNNQQIKFVATSSHTVDWVLNANTIFGNPAPPNSIIIDNTYPTYQLDTSTQWQTPTLDIQVGNINSIYQSQDFEVIRENYLLQEKEYIIAKQLYEDQLKNPETQLRVIDASVNPPIYFKHVITRCLEFNEGTVSPALDYTSRTELAELNQRLVELNTIIKSIQLLYPDITIESGEGQPYS